MTKLFIIGNGFDRDHELKTSYDNFREYLISNTPIETNHLIMPEPLQLPEGEIEYDEIEVLSMLFYLISEAESSNDMWSNVEASLACLNYAEILDCYDYMDLWKMAKNNEDISSNLVIPTLTIQQLFSEWINTIDVNKAKIKKDFRKLLSKKDLFLTFNYTNTLEEIYNVSSNNICYIHGRQNEEILFGHGDIHSDEKADYFMANYIGAEKNLAEIHEGLRKRTDIALSKNADFFERLADDNIYEIYSYGFSFSGVDTIYIKKICERVNTQKVTWYFHDFDQENHNDYIEILKKNGFKGCFHTFNISQ